jgi:two-component system, chemotaxis family, protein-glutamate methylesterase/glutaminase
MNSAATHLPPIRVAHFRVVPEIVAIGTSTGGPDALQDILPQLPADLSVGVIVVQHMPRGFTGPVSQAVEYNFGD